MSSSDSASAEPAPAAGAAPSGELETLRGLVLTATQRLLGDTIAIRDEDWRSASLLPGWTRAHVATHLARQAEALVRLTEWARTGERQEMYTINEQRDSEIEAGVDRSGLDIQIDLDTSAGKLDEAFDALDEASRWDAMVELRGGSQAPARLLPLSRLSEVVLHHLDLDVDFAAEQIDGQTAEWLLEWCAFRLRGREGLPTLSLRSDSGFTIGVGSNGEPTEVRGSSADLLAWLTGRADASAVQGADEVVLPAF